MTVGILRQVILCKQKNRRPGEPSTCLFKKMNWQVSINIKKYKIVFKIRKEHLSIFFYKQLASMQDLENNNQIILDPLGNTYEINTF